MFKWYLEKQDKSLFNTRWAKAHWSIFAILILFKKCTIGLYSDIYRPICFKLRMTLESTKLYILISVWMALAFIQVHSFSLNYNNKVLSFEYYLHKKKLQQTNTLWQHTEFHQNQNLNLREKGHWCFRFLRHVTFKEGQGHPSQLKCRA